MSDKTRAYGPDDSPALAGPKVLSADTASVTPLEPPEALARLRRLNQNLLRSNQRSEQLIKRLDDALDLVHARGSDFVFRLGKDGRFRFASAAAQRLLGRAPADLVSRPFTDLLSAADRAKVPGFLQETMRSDRIEHLRLELRGGDKPALMDCYFRTVPHPQTGAPEILGLACAAAAAAATPEAPGEFGARLAHELSQPLTTIGTTSRICVRRLREQLGADHEITQAIEHLAEQSERATEMIRRLRQLSLGGQTRRSSVSLNQLVEESVNSLAEQTRQAGLHVKLELAPDLPLLAADRIQIGQVLLNLIRNALEALADAPASERRLTVATRRFPGEIEVSVSDSGPGVSPALLEKLFEPYHTTKAHGMGLGLSLCRSIVQAHHGRLWVRSNTPRGATFLFALPLNP